VETFGTAKASDAAINSFVNKILDCSVEGILEGLQLCCLIYLATATYGHFGRVGFTWEELAVNA
jgi:S-adenosylmethionine synthetase